MLLVYDATFFRGADYGSNDFIGCLDSEELIRPELSYNDLLKIKFDLSNFIFKKSLEGSLRMAVFCSFEQVMSEN